MELTARSRFTIWPLRQPFDSAAPSAAEFHAAVVIQLANQRAGLRAADIERHNVPFFSGQIRRSLAQDSVSLLCRKCFPGAICRQRWLRSALAAGATCSGAADLRVGIHHRFPVEIADPPTRRGPPSRATARYSQSTTDTSRRNRRRQNARESAHRTCPQEHRAREARRKHQPSCNPVIVARRSCTSERSTSLTLIHGTRVRGIHLLREAVEKLHARFAVVARHIRINSGDHRKMKIAFDRTLQNHSVRVHQRQIRCPGANMRWECARRHPLRS